MHLLLQSREVLGLPRCIIEHIKIRDDVLKVPGRRLGRQRFKRHGRRSHGREGKGVARGRVDQPCRDYDLAVMNSTDDRYEELVRMIDSTDKAVELAALLNAIVR